jgi:outer membrane protein with beta-barrel domain
MQKKLFPFILSLFILQTVTAQFSDEPSLKRFGFRAGINLSHMNFSKGSPPVNIETSWGSEMCFGFLMVLPLSDKFSFQPEYLYSQMGSKIKNSDTAFKLNYLSLPVFLKFQLIEKLSLMAGPQFDILINAKKTITGQSFNITHDTEERSLGIAAAMEYEIIESLSVCARYMNGFNHIGIGQRSDIQEFKYGLLQLTACVKF